MPKTWEEERPYMHATFDLEQALKIMKPAQDMLKSRGHWLVVSSEAAWEAMVADYKGIDLNKVASERRAFEAWKAKEPKPIAAVPADGTVVYGIRQRIYYSEGSHVEPFYTDDKETEYLAYATLEEAEYALPRDNEDNVYFVYALTARGGHLVPGDDL